MMECVYSVITFVLLSLHLPNLVYTLELILISKMCYSACVCVCVCECNTHQSKAQEGEREFRQRIRQLSPNLFM